MKMIGKIKSGMGNAGFWIKKINRIFEKKFNMKLYNGTLNVELQNNFIIYQTDSNTYKILSNEYGGIYDVLIKKIKLFDGIDAYIVRPEINNKIGGDHPLNLVEIVSDINLRKKFNLKDEDTVIIEIK